MSLDELKAKLLTDPKVKAHYNVLQPEFNKTREVIKENRIIWAKFLRILMYMYLINSK
jgi:hypothetical protein